MDDSEVIDLAAEVFIRNAILQAANDTLYKLQSLIGIKDGGYNPGTAMHEQEHLEALVKDYCDIFKDQRTNSRM